LTLGAPALVNDTLLKLLLTETIVAAGQGRFRALPSQAEPG